MTFLAFLLSSDFFVSRKSNNGEFGWIIGGQLIKKNDERGDLVGPVAESARPEPDVCSALPALVVKN